MWNIKDVTILFIFSTILFIILKEAFEIGSNNQYVKKLYTYRLNKEQYITSIQYIDYENAIKLIIYSRNSTIRFRRCIIVFRKYQKICFPKFIYHFRFIFNLMEIAVDKNVTPKFLILNDIFISIPLSKRSKYNRIVSCYSVMHRFNRPLMLTELIESNLYFGVSKIVFYYLSSSIKVKRILKYYSNMGVIDVYEYVNDSYFKEIENKRDNEFYHFEIFKINHCFNEYKTKTNYMFFLAIDEILWPVKENNYNSMIKLLPHNDFFYLNSFFYKFNYNIPNHRDKDANVILPDIDIFSIMKYCPTSDGYIHKYIILNATKIQAATNHDIYSKEIIKKTYIPNNIAFIRHIRHFNNAIKKHCPNPKLKKENITLIEKKIYQKSINVLKIWMDINRT